MKRVCVLDDCCTIYVGRLSEPSCHLPCRCPHRGAPLEQINIESRKTRRRRLRRRRGSLHLYPRRPWLSVIVLWGCIASLTMLSPSTTTAFVIVHTVVYTGNTYRRIGYTSTSLAKTSQSSRDSDDDSSNDDQNDADNAKRLQSRISQLEQLVASQQVQLRHLMQEVRDLKDSVKSFEDVVQLLRQAGLQESSSNNNPMNEDPDDLSTNNDVPSPTPPETLVNTKVTESLDDADIFGTAPATVMDAADAAGSAILAGLLAGKQRMLVDVRDAELGARSETLVQFIELAILPVAAGLEGLRSKRNRLKLCFPTVAQLLDYRKSMALAAPDVVALSTLAFDPIEAKDNLVVILAPLPDDEEGITAMNVLLETIQQPLIVINHHMVPVTGPAAMFEVAYHLRLLSVQYMTAPDRMDSPERDFFLPKRDGAHSDGVSSFDKNADLEDDSSIGFKTEYDGVELDFHTEVNATSTTASYSARTSEEDDGKNTTTSLDTNLTDTNITTTSSTNSVISEKDNDGSSTKNSNEDALLEAAMAHAQEGNGVHQGTTRAMVIRGYPRPWHVFVDTSPDTDADFQVAATFDTEPSPDQVNTAIIECLEGSEREDDLVAQQMQQALDLGQLDRISDMLMSMGMGDMDFDEELDIDEDEDDPYRDMFGEDTV